MPISKTGHPNPSHLKNVIASVHEEPFGESIPYLRFSERNPGIEKVVLVPTQHSEIMTQERHKELRAIYLQKKPITPSHVSLIDCNIMCLKKYLRKSTDATSRYQPYIQLYTMAHRWLHQWQQTLRHQTRKNLGRCRAVGSTAAWDDQSEALGSTWIYLWNPMEIDKHGPYWPMKTMKIDDYISI